MYWLYEFDDNFKVKSVLIYYDVGRLKNEKYYENGLRNGTWKYYSNDGFLKKKKIYKNNKLIEKIKYKL